MPERKPEWHFFSSKALHPAGMTNTHGLDKNYVLSGFQKFHKRCGRSYRAQKASSCGIVTQICPNGGQNDLFWKTSLRRPFVMTIRLGLMDFKNNFLLPSLWVQKRYDRSYGTQKASPREIMTQICPNGSQNDIFSVLRPFIKPVRLTLVD